MPSRRTEIIQFTDISPIQVYSYRIKRENTMNFVIPGLIRNPVLLSRRVNKLLGT